jgi:hypothetical protein
MSCRAEVQKPRAPRQRPVSVTAVPEAVPFPVLSLLADRTGHGGRPSPSDGRPYPVRVQGTPAAA